MDMQGTDSIPTLVLSPGDPGAQPFFLFGMLIDMHISYLEAGGVQ